MRILVPDLYVRGVIDIDIDLMKKMGIKGIILDVDDTIAEHGSQIPLDGVKEWAKNLNIYGIKTIILSNNFRKRVEPFAEKINMSFISMGLKPFPFGIIKALRKMRIKRNEAVVIGDQIFTDILGANILGIKSILIEPLSDAKSLNLKIKRKFEKKIRMKLKSNCIKRK